jgi:hypothetical protein
VWGQGGVIADLGVGKKPQFMDLVQTRCFDKLTSPRVWGITDDIRSSEERVGVREAVADISSSAQRTVHFQKLQKYIKSLC